jgi:sphingomyelin phosphodiesterase 2
LLTSLQLHAPYEREPNDSYICHRTAQAWEVAKLLRGAAERGHLVIALGDFNMVPLSLAHRLITTHSPVEDVWRTLHPDSSLGDSRGKMEVARLKSIGKEGHVEIAAINLKEHGTTCDSVLNTWRWNKAHKQALEKGIDRIIPLDTPDPSAKRLDYIFIGTDSRPHAQNRNVGRLGQWTVQDVKVGFMDRHPTLKCSLSDHFSVEASIVYTPKAEVKQQATRRARAGSFAHSVGPPAPLPLSTYEEILEMVRIYEIRERRQRRLRLGHFVGQFTVAIGCLVAIWWSPRNYASFLLMLLSTLGLSAGVVDGLIGGLFVGSELRALKEFEWEIRNVVKGLEGVDTRSLTGGASASVAGSETNAVVDLEAERGGA